MMKYFMLLFIVNVEWKNAEHRTLKRHRVICSYRSYYRDIISRKIHKKLVIVVKVGRNEIDGLGQQWEGNFIVHPLTTFDLGTTYILHHICILFLYHYKLWISLYEFWICYLMYVYGVQHINRKLIYRL